MPDTEAQPARPEPKISDGAIYYLIVFAVIADLINLLPLVNILSTLITLPIFQIYFRLKGIKSTSFVVSQMIEFIPIISILPATTAGVVIVIIQDRFGNRVPGPTMQGVKKLASSLPSPLRQDGASDDAA